MTGGDIAGLVAAGVFAVLVALLAVPIIKLGRVFDELRVWIRDLNDETEPLLDEVVRTVATTNSQLEKVDGITDNVSDASANVSAMTSLVASTVGQPIIKVAAFSSGVRQAFSPEAARIRREETRRMRAAAAQQAAQEANRQTQDVPADTRPSADRSSAEGGPVHGTERDDGSTRHWWEGTEWEDPQEDRSVTPRATVVPGDSEPVGGMPRRSVGDNDADGEPQHDLGQDAVTHSATAPTTDATTNHTTHHATHRATDAAAETTTDGKESR